MTPGQIAIIQQEARRAAIEAMLRASRSGGSGGGAPSAHASTHASAGSDPVTLAQSQITNLATDLAGKQPLDSDLTAIAALATTAYGRALLTLANQAALLAAVGAGGSDTQVQFNDGGALAGDSGLTYDKVNNHLKIGGLITPATLALKEDGTNPVLIALDSAASVLFQISGSGSQPQANFGDVEGAYNGTKFELLDGSSTINFTGLDIFIGDNGSRGNGTILNVDDANSQVSLNKDFAFSDANKGPTLIDRTTSTVYRLYVDNGVLGIEAV